MTKEIVVLIIQLIVISISYLVGKYIVPKLSQDDLQKLQLIENWVKQFVNEAATFTNFTGAEKKQYVTEQIVKILNEKGIIMTNEQVSALIETAYNALKVTKEETETMQMMKQSIVMQNLEKK